MISPINSNKLYRLAEATWLLNIGALQQTHISKPWQWWLCDFSKGTTLFPGSILYFFTKCYKYRTSSVQSTHWQERGTYKESQVHKCGNQDKELHNLLKIVLKIIQVGFFIPAMPALKKLSLEDHMFKTRMRNIVNLYCKIFIIIFMVL